MKINNKFISALALSGALSAAACQNLDSGLDANVVTSSNPDEEVLSNSNLIFDRVYQMVPPIEVRDFSESDTEGSSDFDPIEVEAELDAPTNVIDPVDFEGSGYEGLLPVVQIENRNLGLIDSSDRTKLFEVDLAVSADELAAGFRSSIVAVVDMQFDTRFLLGTMNPYKFRDNFKIAITGSSNTYSECEFDTVAVFPAMPSRARIFFDCGDLDLTPGLNTYNINLEPRTDEQAYGFTAINYDANLQVEINDEVIESEATTFAFSSGTLNLYLQDINPVHTASPYSDDLHWLSGSGIVFVPSDDALVLTEANYSLIAGQTTSRGDLIFSMADLNDLVDAVALRNYSGELIPFDGLTDVVTQEYRSLLDSPDCYNDGVCLPPPFYNGGMPIDPLECVLERTNYRLGNHSFNPTIELNSDFVVRFLDAPGTQSLFTYVELKDITTNAEQVVVHLNDCTSLILTGSENPDHTITYSLPDNFYLGDSNQYIVFNGFKICGYFSDEGEFLGLVYMDIDDECEEELPN